MSLSLQQQTLLRQLPGVDRLLNLAHTALGQDAIPKTVLIRSIRTVIGNWRRKIITDDSLVNEADLSDRFLLEQVCREAKEVMRFHLRPAINATGVVVHTNLGRSLLAKEALENIAAVAENYSNLEFDLVTGRRGSRYSAVEDILCELTGAQAAMVVNNNAAAVLLCLETLASGREAIVSRGELVEIGGSFRIPDVMAKSGAILKEVGCTNRTHLRDYQSAVGVDTALILKVHASNYAVVGFTASVSLEDLVALGAKHHIPVMEDLGSGTFIDFSRYGLAKEPTVQESVAAGPDLVTFSGDKLLGGPQAGIILGKRPFIEKIRKNPITRALRIDKMTLAALEATLRLYRVPETAVARIPTLRMLTETPTAIEARARQLADGLEAIGDSRFTIRLMQRFSKAGGGALPLLDLPTRCVEIRIAGISANGIESYLRRHVPPIIGRIEADWIILDLRTIQQDEIAIIEKAFNSLLKKVGS